MDTALKGNLDTEIQNKKSAKNILNERKEKL